MTAFAQRAARRFRAGHLLWIIPTGVLLWWVLRTVPLESALEVLARLTAAQVGVLLAINAAILLLFALRWWLILRALGQHVPLPAVWVYRLGAFAVSYFTPGPQVGGEPLQIYLLRERHRVRATTGTASVVLDRLAEVAVNFSLLAAGVVIVLRQELLGPGLGWMVAAAAGLLLMAPFGLVGLLAAGQRPFSALLALAPARARGLRFRAMQRAVAAGEAEAGVFCRSRPWGMASAVALSLAGWLLMLVEMWLTLAFLGHPLGLVEMALVVTAARVAILMPLPGGLGSLEAGQMLAFSLLGLNPAVGLSFSLIIRIRDITFGALGLLSGGAAASIARHAREGSVMDEPRVEKLAGARIPTEEGEFELLLYSSSEDQDEHLALVMGEVRGQDDVMVRVHSECFTGDVLGSQRCDCGEQLAQAMALIAARGQGVIVYLRQEGRGIGLRDKLRAYNLQDAGYDTVDANLALGHQADERDYTVAARILSGLGVRSIHLLTNNPDKIDALTALGVAVRERVPLQVGVTADNAGYLLTKMHRMNHLLDLDPGAATPSNGSG